MIDAAPVLVLRERSPDEIRAYHDGYRAALTAMQRALIEIAGDPLLAAEPYATINTRLHDAARASALARSLGTE